MKHTLTDFQFDQLKETINIGASNASTALSQMIDKKININVIDANVDSVENSVGYIGNSNDVVTSVLLKLLGDATGMMLFVFPDNSAHNLIRLISKKELAIDFLTEYDRSVLREVGNILSGACLTALSKFLGVSILHSVSEVVTDMLGAIMGSIMAEVGMESAISLVFRVNMTIDGENIKTQLFFLVDPAFTEKILALAKEKYLESDDKS